MGEVQGWDGEMQGFWVREVLELGGRERGGRVRVGVVEDGDSGGEKRPRLPGRVGCQVHDALEVEVGKQVDVVVVYDGARVVDEVLDEVLKLVCDVVRSLYVFVVQSAFGTGFVAPFEEFEPDFVVVVEIGGPACGCIVGSVHHAIQDHAADSLREH